MALSCVGPWRVGVIVGKLGGAVRSTSTRLGVCEVVSQLDVRVLGAVNCRCERVPQIPLCEAYPGSAFINFNGLVEQGRFTTTTRGLLVLRDWLVGHGVTRVGMESTGVYGAFPLPLTPCYAMWRSRIMNCASYSVGVR